MSLTDKLKDTGWILGIPIAFYLICSGVDSLSSEPIIPYVESLRNPFTISKVVAGVIYGMFLLEIFNYNVKNNKK